MDSVASNSSYIPSAKDLLLVLPRLAQRAGSFALSMDNIAGRIFHGGSVIADATGQHPVAESTITNMSAFAQSTASVLDATFREAWTDSVDDASGSLFVSVTHFVTKMKSFGGIFSYLTSKWALTTFAAAVILNRTQFYASSREHLRLRFHMRLALYLIPMLAFSSQVVTILQALRCQTSPDFPQLRYGDPLKHLSIDFAAEGGFLYKLSSTLLFWHDDATCCDARQMSLVSLGDGSLSDLRGSMSLLYWFFITLCASQFFETLTCSLQGKQPMPETGMTIFEHSLAFAECEAMISSALGFGLFGTKDSAGPSIGSSGNPMLNRADIMQRLNVPPEVLLVCLISCFSHLSSAVLAVTGIRHRVRLVNTAIWASCYMSAFFWSFAKIFTSTADQVADLGVLRFPTVCIVGFIPHLLILIGIITCGVVYSLAIVVTALSVPPEAATGLSFRQRLSWAYNNLQANVQFSQSSSIRIKMSEDFYTTLLKIGFNILTAASEAVYLNEGSRIHVARMTWLEQKRIDELAESVEKRKGPAIPDELLGEGIARGVGFIDTQHVAISQSPYARERKSRPTRTEADKQNDSALDSGLGMAQRKSRMHLTLDFVGGIFWLVITLQAQMALSVLRRLNVEYRPAWLLKAAGLGETSKRPSAHRRPIRPDTLDFYVVGADGTPSVPPDDNFDVESEFRSRMQRAGKFPSEEQVDEDVYSWWRKGGRFGNLDRSGDYRSQSEADDDTTSVVSMSTNASTANVADEEDSGRRTPTQQDPFGSRDSTPVPDGELDLGVLSRLLNPQSSADREEARLLSYSLQSDRPMTRHQYRRNMERSRAEILTGLRSGGAARAIPANEEEEESDLEQFILAQRSKAKARAQRSGTWESGAEGMGEGGPQCVVCQCEPRTILVWPCGCLSMCDECRVGLAARNYTKCICCRTDIAAYSRLYVP